MSLLAVAGIDPATHVAEVEDHQPDENDNNTVQIDENDGDNENNLYK